MSDSRSDPIGGAAWLREALARPGTSRHFDVHGARLHALTWNPEERTKPGLLFVHGFVGHAHWWDFIAPFFTDRWQVAALDLSGMGDSARRPVYDALVHARDIAGAIDALGFAPATVVAHSYAGSRTLRASLEAPGRIRRAILIDSHIHFAEEGEIPRFPPLPDRRYPDLASARARFRLHPPQPETHAVLVDHVARHSLREVAGGWTWKFDPTVQSYYERDGDAVLRKVEERVDYVYGADSAVVSPARAARIVGLLPQGRGPIAIPGAFHHVMLDQPEALISALRALLA